MEKETKQKLLEFDRQRQAELFKKAEDAVIKLRDLTKTESRTYTVFSKDLLRNYFKNPYSYQTQLRNLSRYFYRVVNCYRRIIHYNTNFFDLSAYSIIPVTDLTEGIDEEGMLQSYQETAEEMEKMNLKSPPKGEISKQKQQAERLLSVNRAHMVHKMRTARGCSFFLTHLRRKHE